MRKTIQNLPPLKAFLQDLKALGVTVENSGDHSYVVIGGRSNERWYLLPSKNRLAASSGIEMLQPVTILAKVAKSTIKLIVNLGFIEYIGLKKIWLSDLPQIISFFGPQALQVAFFTGTNGPHRKSTMQVMNINGDVLGYVKLSRQEHITKLIKHEASMLLHLKSLRLSSADTPSLIKLYEDNGLVALLSDSKRLPNIPITKELNSLHFQFLEELYTKTKKVGSIELLLELKNQIPKIKPVLGDKWIKLICDSIDYLEPFSDDIAVCLVHGDFTPWNSFIVNDRLYVFDWEYSNQSWPVGYDLAHFVLSTITNKNQFSKTQYILKILAEIYFDGDLKRAHKSLLLSLICHSVFYFGRMIEVNSFNEDWDYGNIRASIIGSLLSREHFFK